VLDGSGFVRRSRMFAGNVAEGGTLKEMLQGLGAPSSALVIMDRGIATEANLLWLKEQGYRYLVVSRERARQFDPEQAVEITTASEEPLQIQRICSEDGQEVRLYCHSPARAQKESAITARFAQRFEKGLTKIADGLQKPHGEKRLDKLMERIGRLKERSHGIGQHYVITLTPDTDTAHVSAISWEQQPVSGSMLTHPGVYCLRSSETSLDAATLWHTYTMLTDLESVFRSLKSELGLRPVFHTREDRTEGHLFITVLAYQAVQALRTSLREQGLQHSWSRLREILGVQQRVTATFRQRDGRTLHVRKATTPEPELRNLYTILKLPTNPGGTKKQIV
ncbi:transposase, partial [Acidithiobacillus sp. MC6.1]|nr:transposase [Acidithiobacillus sp. MC6.1]